MRSSCSVNHFSLALSIFFATFFALSTQLANARSFWAFETGPVRPIALSADGEQLFALNIPDGHLEIFSVLDTGLRQIGTVPVGLEPTALAVRNANEIWVVNHLSDSVSIVQLTPVPHVARTLQVGDEPRDIVFAGPNNRRAFITTAHRGQNHPLDPQLLTPGVGRADVWVFDSEALDETGSPLEILQLFGDTPRALAVSPDGSQVYAAVFHSGNQTSVIHDGLVPAIPPVENTVPPLAASPTNGMIVQYDGVDWRDPLGGLIPDGIVRFSLPDQDVFTIDAMQTPPAVIADYRSVGTVLFNIIANPLTGTVYVSNTEANNIDRFEGYNEQWGNLRGELHKTRITVLDGDAVLPRHLNKHLSALDDYAAENSPAAKQHSLATPTAMAISNDGSTLYLAAYGSSKIGIFDTEELEADTFTPDVASHIELTGGGPSGIALDESRQRLYVLTRFNNAITTVDLNTRSEIASTAMYNPEPASLVAGRPFLYDARFSSSNGEASCASCHVFGDMDSLSWELSVPDAAVEDNVNSFEFINPRDGGTVFHPLKGPMSTQTLRGMDNHGPMHWRGDRTGTTTGLAYDDEMAAFMAFKVAFQGLLGRDEPIADADMQKFAEFALQLIPPPNPIRNLDNSITAQQQLGRDVFTNFTSDFITDCNTCHRMEPENGLFGTTGLSASTSSQQMKIPQLRNLYQKVGMFGIAAGGVRRFIESGDPAAEQIRGFGYAHDGAADTLDSFHAIPGFNFFQAQNAYGIDRTTAIAAVTDFLFVFPSNLAPVVGQQITLGANPTTQDLARLDLLEQRASTPFTLKDEPNAYECDLVVNAYENNRIRGWLYIPQNQLYQPDTFFERVLNRAELLAIAQSEFGGALTFTCAPPGAGVRMALDRDEDFMFDGHDRCLGDITASQDRRSFCARRRR